MQILQNTVSITRNALLAALPTASLRLVLARAQFASVRPGQVIYTPATALQRVLFPIEGMFSVLVPGDEANVETALIGAEGFVGLPLLFGVKASREIVIARSLGYSVALTARSFKQ